MHLWSPRLPNRAHDEPRRVLVCGGRNQPYEVVAWSSRRSIGLVMWVSMPAARARSASLSVG